MQKDYFCSSTNQSTTIYNNKCLSIIHCLIESILLILLHVYICGKLCLIDVKFTYAEKKTWSNVYF